MYNYDNQDNERSDNVPKIRVVIRKRPIGKKELVKNDVDIIDIRGPQTVVVSEMKAKVDLTKYIEEHNFNFDAAYDESISNEKLYYHSVRPLVDAAFSGAKVTCFAYGQTGSGKTYTMMGDSANFEHREIQNPVPGLYLLATQDIFSILKTSEFSDLSIWISFYEIYCGKLFDLLNGRQQLFAREDAKQNVNIVGLVEKKINNVNGVMELIEFGLTNRVTGVTGANDDSSRSHAILQVVIKTRDQKVHGKMSFIDLAGSERGADVVDQNKQTRFDGAEINKSLLALKECIRALDQDKKHTPFRGSKLTLVLKDSFTGNCRTLMIGNISPCATACEHTLNTLRYADRVKELKRPSTNSDQPLSGMDMLSKQLMLARQTKNTTKIPLSTQSYNSVKTTKQSHSNHESPVKLHHAKTNENDIDQMGLFDIPHIPHQPYQSVNLNNIFTNGSSNNTATKQKPVIPSLVKQNSSPSTTHLFSNVGKSQTNISKSPTKKPQSGHASANNSVYNTPQKNPSFKNIILSPEQQFQHMSKDEILNWRANNEDDLQVMSSKHEQLIGVILNEEEEVIGLHRQHIDDMVELTKQEMVLLNEIDRPGSDVDEYVDNLDAILAHKMDIIMLLRNRIGQFKDHLKEEELMTKKFYQQRNEFIDVFDLGADEFIGKQDEIQLLSNLPKQNIL